MAVIGVLLGLAVFGIQALQKAQRETQRLQDLKNIQGQLESYYSKAKSYPIGWGCLSASGAGVTTNQVRVENIDDSEGNAVATGNFVISGNTWFGNGFSSTFPIQSQTPEFGYLAAVPNPDISYANMSANGCGSYVATADHWYIFYLQLGCTSQEYALFACTENGLTANLGSKND